MTNRVIDSVPVGYVSTDTISDVPVGSSAVRVEVETVNLQPGDEAPIVLVTASLMNPVTTLGSRLSATTARQLAQALIQAADEVDPPAPSGGSFSI